MNKRIKKYNYVKRENVVIATVLLLIVPILKCKNKDATNVGNYRPIAVATTISRLFEHLYYFT